VGWKELEDREAMMEADSQDLAMAEEEKAVEDLEEEAREVERIAPLGSRKCF
jgi:hypothetical protein